MRGKSKEPPEGGRVTQYTTIQVRLYPTEAQANQVPQGVLQQLQ